MPQVTATMTAAIVSMVEVEVEEPTLLPALHHLVEQVCSVEPDQMVQLTVQPVQQEQHQQVDLAAQKAVVPVQVAADEYNLHIGKRIIKWH
jgi:hypothetical protein